ncbi:hypothetical protein ES703_38008 [subsurface metagenome]
MKNKKLVIALGLVALLLMTVGIAGCSRSSVESEPPGNDQSANPLEDITDPNESDDETSTTKAMEFSISSEDWPEGRMVADGIIQKVTGNTFDLRQEKIEIVIEDNVGRMKEDSQPEIKMWQVVFSSSTEVLRLKFSGTGEMQTEKASVHDIKQGRKAYIWGEVDGQRIFADSILLWY